MKKKTILLGLVSLLATMSLALRAQEYIDFGQLPAAIQNTINDQRGEAGVLSVEKVYSAGTPLYYIRLSGPSPDSSFYVTESGTLIKPSALIPTTRSVVPEPTRVVVSSLPAAVQNALEREFGNIPIPSVEVITGNGHTSYVVPARINDQMVDVWMDPNGNVLSLSPPRVLLSDRRRINPGDLPLAAQETLRTYAGDAPIINVTRGSVHGQTVYDALFKREGRDVELRIAGDGSLVRDLVNDRFLAQTGRMTRDGLAASAPVRLNLSNPSIVSFNQLPLQVLSTIQKYAGSDFIPRIEKGFARGQTVYDALIRHSGQDIALRVSQDGTLVDDRVNNRFLVQLGTLPPVGLGRAPLLQTGSGTSSDLRR